MKVPGRQLAVIAYGLPSIVQKGQAQSIYQGKKLGKRYG